MVLTLRVLHSSGRHSHCMREASTKLGRESLPVLLADFAVVACLGELLHSVFKGIEFSALADFEDDSKPVICHLNTGLKDIPHISLQLV